MECKGTVVVWSNLVYVQHEAAKVQQGIAALLAEKAQAGFTNGAASTAAGLPRAAAEPS